MLIAIILFVLMFKLAVIKETQIKSRKMVLQVKEEEQKKLLILRNIINNCLLEINE